MARNMNLIFQMEDLYSRSGKVMSMDLDKTGQALGLIAAEPSPPPKLQAKAKSPESKKDGETSPNKDSKLYPGKAEKPKINKPRLKTPKSLYKLMEIKGPVFNTVTREEREKVSVDRSPKPSVGYYLGTMPTIGENAFHPFISELPKSNSPLNRSKIT